MEFMRLPADATLPAAVLWTMRNPDYGMQTLPGLRLNHDKADGLMNERPEAALITAGFPANDIAHAPATPRAGLPWRNDLAGQM